MAALLTAYLASKQSGAQAGGLGGRGGWFEGKRGLGVDGISLVVISACLIGGVGLIRRAPPWLCERERFVALVECSAMASH